MGISSSKESLFYPIFSPTKNSSTQNACLGLGPKKYQKIARMYDRTGLSTKCTVIKTGFKNFRTGTEVKSRPFVDAPYFWPCWYKNEPKNFVLRQVGDTGQSARAADSQRPENLPQRPELVSLLSLVSVECSGRVESVLSSSQLS